MSEERDRSDDFVAADVGGAVVLPEPVRQRLVQVAAEVLGRLPADEVPPALRTIARFTPAKRARLGAPVLSAALDADEGFRAQVADAVAAASPQLVDSINRNEATPASDPMDAAVVAYLSRPEGWTQLIADVGARWADEQAGRDAAADELSRLRADITDLRSQLKAQAAAHADAITAAVAEASEEATRLRNTLRGRTAELRALQADSEQVDTALADARAELQNVRSDYESQLRALRERAEVLDRAGEAQRREARAVRDVDAARLRLLLDTLTEAAAGVRRELALPAGTLRPADALGTAGADQESGPAGTAGRTGLDQLLELPQVHLVLDGYNVTKTGYPELPLADQRARLIASMAALQARTNAEITIAFDGGARPPAQPRTPRGVRVLFSAPDEPADDLIRRLVSVEPSGRAVVVVTSDRAVATDVARAGAWTVPSAALLDRLG